MHCDVHINTSEYIRINNNYGKPGQPAMKVTRYAIHSDSIQLRQAWGSTFHTLIHQSTILPWPDTLIYTGNFTEPRRLSFKRNLCVSNAKHTSFSGKKIDVTDHRKAILLIVRIGWSMKGTLYINNMSSCLEAIIRCPDSWLFVTKGQNQL